MAFYQHLPSFFNSDFEHGHNIISLTYIYKYGVSNPIFVSYQIQETKTIQKCLSNVIMIDRKLTTRPLKMHVSDSLFRRKMAKLCESAQ